MGSYTAQGDYSYPAGPDTGTWRANHPARGTFQLGECLELEGRGVTWDGSALWLATEDTLRRIDAQGNTLATFGNPAGSFSPSSPSTATRSGSATSCG